MELRDYLKVVRERWVWIVGCALFVGLLALGYTTVQAKQYASDARLFVSTATESGSDAYSINQGGQFSIARVQSYADLLSSRELASEVVDDLDLELTSEELARKVSGSVAANTVNLTLTVTDADPHQAQRIAQAYAESLADLVRQLETPPGETVAPVKATIVDAASFSDTPVAPKPVRTVGIGIVLGLLLGLGLAVLRQSLDTRIKTIEDIAQITDRPVLGAISYEPGNRGVPLVTEVASHSPRAEAFRVLRTNLQFVDVDSRHKVFVLSSAVPDEGKTSTAVNLAVSLAQAGARTLLVEGDLRRPRAAMRLGMDGAVGLTSVLVGTLKFQDSLQRDETTGLDFLAAGPVPPNPAELLQSNAMRDLLEIARAAYDVVIVDAPPLLPVTDAALLAAHGDGAILVVRHGKVTRDQVKLSAERLAQVDARLFGVVMNMVPAKGHGFGYGYGYGYAPESDATSS
ncbi:MULTISPECIES: polysaccharide biosynthesis tyrosine autokinase [unclassified Nocardioides]|uniref:polysaccharide biosynthesis tyrosine autokinase n=1 Tax=unclassified Nocardioides TaxID=2615069 RepID=UPI003606927A